MRIPVKLHPAAFLALVICAFASVPMSVQATPIQQHSSPTFHYSDALIAPDLSTRYLRAASGAALLSQSPSPGYFETSEYLIGSAAVGVVFLESNGTVDSSTEDWTSTRESWVVGNISSGLSWLAGYYLNASVSFVYDIHYGVPTSYEPITRPYTNESLWIGEAMAYLGYSGTYYFTQVRDYVNSLRVTNGTDWAFAIFVVDSLNDADGKFSDNYFAYAYLGGPFLVVTYDNDNYGISNMDWVSVHETAHIFYATDEYDNVVQNSGYLNAPDTQFTTNCIMGQTSLPGSLPWNICSNTQLQLGWRDTDGDGVQDIVDTFPDTALNPYYPDPTNRTALSYSGSVAEVPYPNNNPFGTSRDVTINTITMVEFREDGGAWQNSSAVDGAFDESEELFAFTTSALSSGAHLIETRGNNSVGNNETSFASDTVTVDLIPPVTSLSCSSPSYAEGATTYVSRRTNFTLTASDTSGVASTYCKIDSGSWASYTGVFNLSDFSEGGHTIYFYSTDNAGNIEATNSFYAFVDDTEPTVSPIFPVNGTAAGSSDVSVSWTGSDNGSGIDHYETKIDSGSYINKGASTSHTFLSVSEGSHTVRIRGFDKLGNSRELLINFVVDVSSPTVTIDSPALNAFINSSDVTAMWKGTDALSGIDHFEVRLDDESWTDVGALRRYSLSGIGDGSHELTVKAVDKAGNSAVSSVTFTVDATPPVVTLTSPTNGSNIRSSFVEVSWSGTDEVSGIDHYEIRLSERSWINVGTSTALNLTDVSDGSHRLIVRAIDVAGNYREVYVDFLVNTSLIGGPGWVDDIVIFVVMGVIAVLAISLFIRKRSERWSVRKV